MLFKREYRLNANIAIPGSAITKNGIPLLNSIVKNIYNTYYDISIIR